MKSKGTSRVWVDIDLRASGKQAGHAYVPHSSDFSAYGAIPIPIGSIKCGEGPTVLLMGGVHGDEPEAQIAIKELFREIPTNAVSGTLLFLPSMNYPACVVGRRVSPIDGLNLNRVFPGDPDGSPTLQIAYFIESVLAPMADVWFDLHSGGASLQYIPLVARHTFKDETLNSHADELIDVFGGRHALIWPFFDEPRMAKGCAERLGVTYIGSEFGGGATASRSYIDLCKAGLKRCFSTMGVLHHESIPVIPDTPPNRYEVRGRDDYTYAREAGLFSSFVDLGQRVEKGQRLGRVEPTLDMGDRGRDYDSTVSGIVVCMRHLVTTSPGDVLFQVAHPI